MVLLPVLFLHWVGFGGGDHCPEVRHLITEFPTNCWCEGQNSWQNDSALLPSEQENKKLYSRRMGQTVNEKKLL